MRVFIRRWFRRSPLAVLLVVAACASPSPSPSASGTLTPIESASPSADASESTATPPSESASGSSEGTETSVFDIEVGDCFSASVERIESVVVVDCSEAHVYEAYATFDHPATDADEYPADMTEYSNGECEDRFEAYVARDYANSIWYITSVSPSEETWAVGDREIVCTLNNQDETEVTGSAEGSGD